MKFAERLQAQQPVVYQTLKHALMQKKLAHAFLFVGQKGTPRLETALLLAQSRICQHVHDGFACEECIDCQRIAEGNYADLILLDGASKSIKKEEIRSLQERFNKTGLGAQRTESLYSQQRGEHDARGVQQPVEVSGRAARL